MRSYGGIDAVAADFGTTAAEYLSLIHILFMVFVLFQVLVMGIAAQCMPRGPGEGAVAPRPVRVPSHA